MSSEGKRKDAPGEDPSTKRPKEEASVSGEEAAAPAVAAADDAATRTADAAKPPAVKEAPSRYPPIPGGKESYPENFDHYLFQLLLYKADHNNFNVPRDEHPELHGWMQFLKREFKHFGAEEGGEESTTHLSSLTPEQFKVLSMIHVPLTSRGDDHWNRFYNLLLMYKEQHGHALVPRLCEIPGLGDWVTDQRRQYKAWKQGQPTQLTAVRREKLKECGFVWQVRNRPDWDNRFKELAEYAEKNGDCRVPQHYKPNKALGKWVAKQREQYKLLKKGQHSFLTPYRLEKLNSIGFAWQVRTSMDGDLLPSEESPAAHSPPEDGDDKQTPNESMAV